MYSYRNIIDVICKANNRRCYIIRYITMSRYPYQKAKRTQHSPPSGWTSLTTEATFLISKGVTLSNVSGRGLIGTVLQFEAVRSFSFYYGHAKRGLFQSEIVAGKSERLNDSQLARSNMRKFKSVTSPCSTVNNTIQCLF